MEVAEITVQLAGDPVDVCYLPPGGSYRIGTARDVDLPLAVPGVASFPLVGWSDGGFVVRGLPGVVPPTRLEPGIRIDVAIDRVTISIALVDSSPRVARPRLEWRPLVFAVCSLAAHLALWQLALTSDGEDTIGVEVNETPGATRVARYATPAQTVRREPRHAPADVPVTTAVTATPQPTTEPPAAPEAASRGKPGLALAGRSPVPEDSSDDAGDRSSRRFDPASRPDFDTIKTGPYTTISTGRAAGDHYGADAKRTRLVVVSCDEMSCVVIGGDRAAPIRKAVESRLADIT